ncbi:MAG: aminoglycoside phosphotransferase family protein [Lachnospiraceae bacterium]|nr:aminoglycoside phosphotransferase family protein [Lachnospiraceae bacterium]
MNEEKIVSLCQNCMAEQPKKITRCTVGHGNYVYIVELMDRKVVVRCSEETGAYKDTIYWLEKLETIDIPVPRVLGKGMFEGYEYLILTYFEGQDIGLVYTELTAEEKREIARAVVDIQNKVSAVQLEDIPKDWSWKESFVDDMLSRAKERIIANGCYFEPEKVDRLMEESTKPELADYFASIRPVAYLDDISTKNLLIHEGHVSGVIDIDWMDVGDKLTFAAMTKMALMNMGCDTDYVTYLLEEMHLNGLEQKAFTFYALLFCVDFMGERGMWFMDKQVPVNEEIVKTMNGIYERLWEEYINVEGSM